MAINFKTGYNSQAFRNFLRVNLLGDKFNEYSTPERLLPGKTQYFVNNEIYRIGEISGIEKDVSILQIKQKSKNDPRVSLTKDTFKLMQDYGIKNAIVVLRVDNISSWRLSLLTTSYNEDLKKEMSNPRRFSYILGPYEKVRTPEQYLIEQGFIKSFEDLKDRFNVEVVRKNFFTLYIDLFLEVYDNIISNNTFSKIIKEGEIEPVSFAKNLMGKLIFLYFIQKKGWLGIRDRNTPFGEGDRDFFKHNIERLATEGNLFHQHSNFYNDFLEPLFYSGLNQKNPDDWHEGLQMKVPYLNGGLFEEEYDRQGTSINLNNQIFKNIIDSFDTYNFTIDEDDPIDSEIAVDPEMLGMIFESMISITKDNIDEHLENFKKAKERNKVDFVNQDNILNLHLTKGNNKDLGAFYTPREIVNYMTKESIYNYLVNELQKNNPTEQEEIDNIVKKLFEYKDKHLTKGEIDEQEEAGYSLIKKYVFDIKEALTNIKILDPAVGSGAFPMGILQEILWLTRYLIDVFHLEKKSNYEIKKDIIQNNIHGVDIDPGAVDIARLRFWLCLIVDADYPVPLPNLDFKFVCANTLIPLDKGGLFVNEEFVSTLKNIKDEFFLCSDHTKKDNLRKLFFYTKESLFTDKDKLEGLRGSDGRVTKQYKKAWEDYVKSLADVRVKQMLQWDPFDTNHSNERFDPKMMFDVDCFDIVIGNPPYTSNLDKEQKALLGELYPAGKKKKRFDLYNFFMVKALELLHDKGIGSFIVPQTRLLNQGNLELRKALLDNGLFKISILGGNMFELAVVDTLVYFVNKKERSESVMIGNGCIENGVFVSADVKSIEPKEENLYVLQFNYNEENENLLRKCGENSLTMGEISRIVFGIQTRKDKTSPTYLYDTIINNRCKEVINGKDMGMYYYTSPKLYVDYGDHLWNKRDPSIFEAEEKILLRQVGDRPICAYDSNQIYTLNTIYNIIIKNTRFQTKYVLGILNSKLVAFLWKIIFPEAKDAFPRIKKEDFVKIPIKEANDESQKEIIDIVDKIIEIKATDPKENTKELENRINQIVYKLYGLTEDEIKIVEESIK